MCIVLHYLNASSMPPIIAHGTLNSKPMTKVHNPAAGNHWKSQGLEFHVNEFGNIYLNLKIL